MRVAVSGATGLIGSELVRALTDRGDQVIALTRNIERARGALPDGVEFAEWADPESGPRPRICVRRRGRVVHLLGEPIAQRWTDETKRKIRDSRVLGTRNLIAGINAAPEARRPKVLVSQSATGYYGPRDDARLDESASPGHDFLADVTAAWEHEALQAQDGVRVALPRTGVVLSPSGGALAKMLPPFRLGVGGPVAGGKQYVPWIHLDDVVGGLIRCIDDPQLAGPVNLTAPTPVTNAGAVEGPRARPAPAGDLPGAGARGPAPLRGDVLGRHHRATGGPEPADGDRIHVRASQSSRVRSATCSAATDPVSVAVVWYRRDLRLADHPALTAAAECDHVVPVFCFDPRLLHGRHASGPRTAVSARVPP